MSGTAVFMNGNADGTRPRCCTTSSTTRCCTSASSSSSSRREEVPHVLAGRSARGSSRWARASGASRCATASWTTRTSPKRSGVWTNRGLRFKLEEVTLLPRPRDADRFRPGGRDGGLAREALRVHVAQRAARDHLLLDPARAGRRARHAGRALKAERARLTSPARRRRPPGKRRRCPTGGRPRPGHCARGA